MSESKKISGQTVPDRPGRDIPVTGAPPGTSTPTPRVPSPAGAATSGTFPTSIVPAPRPQSLDIQVDKGLGARFVFGIFPDLRKASVAMLGLEERGFPPEDITLRLSKENRDVIEGRRVFRDQRGGSYVARAPVALRKERAWKAGLAVGATAGAAVGAVLATLAGPGGAATVTMFGLVFAARAIVAWALVGFGGALGAVLGSMYGLTRSQYTARDYDTVRTLEGAILGVTVHDDNEADAIERSLRAGGAEIVSSA